MQNIQLKLLVLRCSNLDASKAFYENLGFCFSIEKHGKGPIHYSSENAGFVFELYPLGINEAIDNLRLGFSIKNSTFIQTLSIVSSYEANGKIIKIIQDPDGRKVEIDYENL